MPIPFRAARHKTKFERKLFRVPLCSERCYGQFYSNFCPLSMQSYLHAGMSYVLFYSITYFGGNCNNFFY